MKIRPYRVLNRETISDGHLELRAIEPDQIEAIRRWRNSQMSVLRQAKRIKKDEQMRYFTQCIWPEASSLTPNQILLSITQSGIFVGYGGLVHISWPNKRAEISFLLSPKLEERAAQRKRVFASFLAIMKDIAFGDLSLSRIWTETYANRRRHIATLEEAGFKREGRLKNHVIIGEKPTDSLIHAVLKDEWRRLT
jgi:RimJ/RimL family protein N-acetyltransferase